MLTLKEKHLTGQIKALEKTLQSQNARIKKLTADKVEMQNKLKGYTMQYKKRCKQAKNMIESGLFTYHQIASITRLTTAEITKIKKG